MRDQIRRLVDSGHLSRTDAGKLRTHPTMQLRHQDPITRTSIAATFKSLHVRVQAPAYPGGGFVGRVIGTGFLYPGEAYLILSGRPSSPHHDVVPLSGITSIEETR